MFSLFIVVIHKRKSNKLNQIGDISSCERRNETSQIRPSEQWRPLDSLKSGVCAANVFRHPIAMRAVPPMRESGCDCLPARVTESVAVYFHACCSDQAVGCISWRKNIVRVKARAVSSEIKGVTTLALLPRNKRRESKYTKRNKWRLVLILTGFASLISVLLFDNLRSVRMSIR